MGGGEGGGEGGDDGLELKEWVPSGGAREEQQALSHALSECERIGSTVLSRLMALRYPSSPSPSPYPEPSPSP
jgi:hypothetical protein